ncbi:Hypothetical protein SmN45_3604 [Serratia marcescens]|nr:Hypothetical protein SmN45_3604 [Serratia marcescens]
MQFEKFTHCSATLWRCARSGGQPALRRTWPLIMESVGDLRQCP